MRAHFTAAKLREAFLSFFEKRGHRRVPSSSLVPASDPTLLFTNAGMVQFKDVFTGKEHRDYLRAVSTQRCVRAGGKHNDLDNVGFTARHHTFFEMLGNFSFGDYFKADAIAWAWEFVTKELALDPARLAVTVFVGEQGIPADDEAATLWAKVGVPKERIRRLGMADNFWAMGDIGPCGPCSEIYYFLPDRPPRADEHPGESDSWLEIWNLVFMQFERKVSGGPLLPLPKPCVDTGAGLERIASVVQQKHSNYDTDLFTPIIAKVEELSHRRYEGRWDSPADAAMRIVADHARATAFLAGDGVQPSNEGRGYVLRRIMRRAIRHADQHLGLDYLFFALCVDSVISTMAEAFPLLKEHRPFILEVAQHEEETFRRTLRRGLQLIAEEVRVAAGGSIPGTKVWDLHQTYGFPADLTEIISKEHGLTIDRAGFEALLEQERARASGGQLNDATALTNAHLRLATEFPPTEFVGHEDITATGRVLAILQSGERVQSATAPADLELLVDRTPFYAEGGGQVGDTGQLLAPKGEGEVLDCQKPTGAHFLHMVRLTKGTVAVGEEVKLAIDAARRTRIRANHSATHLLHRALKVVLGPTVSQKGSVVAPESLRFDFSHYSPVTKEELARIEDLVNLWIRDNAATTTVEMPLEEARASGAVALFGEKYGERVRVVCTHPESIELCGGTHTRRSGDIGLFRIVGESSIAAGVRRISAMTGSAALTHTREQERALALSAELLKTTPAELAKRIEALQRRAREFEEALAKERLSQESTEPESLREVHGIKVLTQRIRQADPELLRQLADKLRDRHTSAVVGLGGETADGKALILVAATKDLVAAGFKSGDAVRELATSINGKGGGRADIAQAGGTDPSRVPEALERLFRFVEENAGKSRRAVANS